MTLPILSRLLAALALAILVLSAPAALAQQTPQPPPEAFAEDRGLVENPSRIPVEDERVLLETLGLTEQPPGRIDGFTSFQNQELGFVVAPGGRTWRDFRSGWSPWILGILIALALLAVLGLFFVVGSTTGERDPQGRRVPRFGFVDRVVHWTTAIAFVVLALTGLTLVFGRWLLQPLIGDRAFGSLAQAGLVTHNALGFVFLLGILLMTVMWIRQNIPDRVDLEWFRRGGGILTKEHIPAGKFNGGQKAIFWITVLGGLAMGASGILLLLPIATIGMGGMQIAHGVHVIVAALMIATIIGHVYLGTVGVAGAFDAMWKGHVDRQWARVHHPLWLERPPARDEHPSP